MHITPQELTQVAAVAPRFDLYTGIHKAVRAAMADALLAVGRMDGSDAAECDAVAARVQVLLDDCRNHLRHENEFVHPALEARAPGASERIAHEHEEHVAAIIALEGRLAALRQAAAEQRLQAARELYRDLALFVAHNFEHMHVEETAHNAVLWARYTDAELLALHDELLASIPPAEMMAWARWLLPFQNRQERAAMLLDMRGKAPAEAFEVVLELARTHLTQAEWGKLRADLGM